MREQGTVEASERVKLEVIDRGKNWVHTTVVDDETGKPVPCRVHLRSPEDIPYAPHGHNAHVNSNTGTWHIDVGSDVRMGICLGHATMRGPARMANANITTKRLSAYQTVKTCQLANRTGDFKTAAIVGDNASTVIATIFQPPQRIQERVTTINKTDSPYDSTHMNPLENKAAA